MKHKFTGNQLVYTPGIVGLFMEVCRQPEYLGQTYDTLIHHYFNRHFSGDWGVIGEDSVCQNERAIAEDATPYEKSAGIYSIFELNHKRFWIKTEHDRSVTTMYLPEED